MQIKDFVEEPQSLTSTYKTDVLLVKGGNRKVTKHRVLLFICHGIESSCIWSTYSSLVDGGRLGEDFIVMQYYIFNYQLNAFSQRDAFYECHI